MKKKNKIIVILSLLSLMIVNLSSITIYASSDSEIKENTIITDNIDVNSDNFNEDDLIVYALSYDKREEIINKLINGILNPSSVIDVTEYTIPKAEIIYLLKQTFNKNFTLYNSIRDLRCVYTYDSQKNTINTIKFISSLNASSINERYKELKLKISDIVENIDLNSTMSDYEKALKLHDYLCSNFEYIEDTNTIDSNIINENRTAYNLLINKKGFSSGFANTYKLLLNALEIDCKIVEEKDVDTPHSWNLVKIDDDWYHVDISSDILKTDSNSFIKFNHKYFMKTDSEIAELGYSNWDSNKIQATSSRFSNSFINNINNNSYYHNGYWYYSTLDGIYSHSVDTNSTNLIKKIDTSNTILENKGTIPLAEFNNKLYYAEGLCIYSCAYDGSNTNLIVDMSNTFSLYDKSAISSLSISASGKLSYYIHFEYYSSLLYVFKTTQIYDITLNSNLISLPLNQTLALINGSTFNNIDQDKNIWMSDDNNIATVSSLGEITANSIGSTSIWLSNNTYTTNCTVNVTPNVNYSTHVQNIGWENYVSDGESSSDITTSNRTEAIKIKITGDSNLNVEYSTHIENIGWTNWVSNNELSGTTGQSKRLEAIKIKLSGEDAEKYNIYYKAYVDEKGWTGWAKNGEICGSTGYALPIKSIEIILKSKYDLAPGTTNNINFQKPPTVSYRSHIEKTGWNNFVSNGKLSGTTGKSKRMEAIQLSLSSSIYSGNIMYRTHIQSHGWQDWKYNGTTSGTISESKRLEAIEIKLTGEIANIYDIYYRVHVESYGWLGWAKNGETSGTTGLAKRLEAIEVVLIKKYDDAPGLTYNSYLF